MTDRENYGRTIQWDNPVARRPSPPDKREQYACIVCLEECLGLDRENICIVGGECRFSAHEKCLTRWFQTSLVCPVCREAVEVEEMLPSEQRNDASIGIDVNDIDTDDPDRTCKKCMVCFCGITIISCMMMAAYLLTI